MHALLRASPVGAKHTKITTLVSLQSFRSPILVTDVQTKTPRMLSHRRHVSMCPPCRVTNEGREVRVKQLLEQDGMLDDDEYMVIDPHNPPPHPELGPLERRVSLAFEEALEQDIVDEEAMQWWFTEPPQGWATEKRRVKKAPVVPMDGYDSVRHECAEADGRRPLSQLKAGDILVGTVVNHMLYHGVQVDVGFEADGLIWVSELEAWRALGDAVPELGSRIEVVVHAVREDPIFRFPLQLAPNEPRLAARVPRPEDHIAPLDLREVPMSEYSTVAEKSGRHWAPRKVIVPARTDVTPAPEAKWLTIEEMLECDDIAAGIF
jgi:hypothetical protein